MAILNLAKNISNIGNFRATNRVTSTTFRPRLFQASSRKEYSASDKAKEAVNQGANEAKQTGQKIKDEASSTASQVSQKTKEMADKASDKAKDMTSKAKEKMQNAWDSAKGAAKGD